MTEKYACKACMEDGTAFEPCIAYVPESGERPTRCLYYGKCVKWERDVLFSGRF